MLKTLSDIANDVSKGMLHEKHLAITLENNQICIGWEYHGPML